MFRCISGKRRANVNTACLVEGISTTYLQGCLLDIASERANI